LAVFEKMGYLGVSLEIASWNKMSPIISIKRQICVNNSKLRWSDQ